MKPTTAPEFIARHFVRCTVQHSGLVRKPSKVKWLTLRESPVLLGLGVLGGIPLSLAMASAVRAQLFDVRFDDPKALLTSVSILLVSAGVAAWIPTYRAAKIDPIVALRDD